MAPSSVKPEISCRLELEYARIFSLPYRRYPVYIIYSFKQNNLYLCYPSTIQIISQEQLNVDIFSSHGQSSPGQEQPEGWEHPLSVFAANIWIIGFMVFKLTGLDSRFQCKNRFKKICTESQDITKKVYKIGLPNQTCKIWYILTDISGLDA